MNNRLMVYVRVKPLHDQRSIIDIVDDKTLIFDPIDPEENQDDVYFYHGRQFKTIGQRKKKNSPYVFDGVFDDRSTNRSIFETVTRPMVDATIDGYNCSVFAYGATGSGKTYTMLGKPNNPGVIYHTTKDLFEKLSEISEKDPLPAQLKICYFEVYNESVRDLLVFEPNNFIRCGNKRLRTTPERCRARSQLHRDGSNLPVCESAGGGQTLVIPDLTYHTPENAEQLIELLEAGNANRSQHPTDANADSSRSHAIFQIMLTRRTRRLNNNNQDGSEYELQNSKMSLIDLAGSERASVAYKAGNDRSKNLQMEGGNINKSLLALGNCINALAKQSEHKNARVHIPYRNSKLTRLLRDSLGGKCRTAMIATICQQQGHYDDIQNTLLYASRAKCIKLQATRNCTNVALQPKNYSFVIANQGKLIATLQSENEQLKMQLAELKRENDRLRAQPRLTFTDRNPNATFITAGKTPDRFLDESDYRPTLVKLYEERGNIKLDILKYESKYRTNELKLAFKQLDDVRQRIASGGGFKGTGGNSTFLKANELTGNLPINNNNNNNGDSQAIRAQLRYYEQERAALLERAETNEKHIEDVLQDMSREFVEKRYGSREEFEDIISNFVNEIEINQELEEKKFCEQHAYDLAQQGFNRLASAEDLLNEAASIVKRAYTVYKGHGKSDSDPPVWTIGLPELLKKLGKKSVIWKDDKWELENNKDNQPLSQLASIHENFSLNFLTPFRNNNTLLSRRLSKNLVSLSNYTPEQSNLTFDASS
uniref:Kinesin-like protein n=1 Tax=Aceria tosichella TaxID=561515 RepID=A0A6G1SDW0_9ACAR